VIIITRFLGFKAGILTLAAIAAIALCLSLAKSLSLAYFFSVISIYFALGRAIFTLAALGTTYTLNENFNPVKNSTFLFVRA